MPSRRTLLKSTAVLLAGSKLTFAGTAMLNRKKIPSSGEPVPVVGIGTNRYGVGSDAEALIALRETLASFAGYGGGVIDTAPGYGSSESVLGNLIDQTSQSDKFFIATKCDESGGDETRAQLASSTSKLKSGVLDLVAVHNLRNWRDQLPVLQQAKEAGNIRYVGVTTSRTGQFDEVAKILKTQQLDFVQLNYSLADRSAEQVLLPLAAEREVAVMVNLPFARGRLFEAAAGKVLPQWAGELGINSWARFFLKFIVSHPAVTCAIPGTRKVRHLVDNLGAAAGPAPDREQRLKMAAYFDEF